MLRTKQYKELFVAQSALAALDDVYVPLFRTKRRRLGKFVDRTEALFPCYIFARFQLAKCYHRLIRSPGVVGVVSVGGEPAEVNECMIHEIRSHETNGVIILPVQMFQPMQPVTITEGPLSGIDAVFERYLSGPERAAVLLNTIGRANVRAIVRTSTLSPNTTGDVA